MALGKVLDDNAKLGFKHGTFGCMGDCNDFSSYQCRTCACFGPVQAGINNELLDSSCCCGVCCALTPCLPVFATCQRYKARKHFEIAPACIKCGKGVCEDILCAFFFPACVMNQIANEFGEKAAFTNHKILDLMKSPTMQQMKYKGSAEPKADPKKAPSNKK